MSHETNKTPGRLYLDVSHLWIVVILQDKIGEG